MMLSSRNRWRETFGYAFLLGFALFISISLPAQQSETLKNNDDDIRDLIASRQLDRAEKLIAERMEARPKDAELMTLMAEVQLGQGHAQAAQKTTRDAEQAGG